MSTKLNTILGFIIPVQVILQTICNEKRRFMENCHHCNGTGYIITIKYLQYNSGGNNDDGFNDEMTEQVHHTCHHCKLHNKKISQIESIISTHVTGNLKVDNLNLLYQMFLLNIFSCIIHTPSKLEFEIYIWFLLSKKASDFSHIIYEYFMSGYMIDEIQKCVININMKYLSRRYESSFKLVPIFFDEYMHEISSLLPISLKKLNYEYNKRTYYISKFVNMFEKVSYDIIEDKSISFKDRLTMFCQLNNLKIDIDNMLYIQDLYVHAELEDAYYYREVNYQNIKNAHNDNIKILYFLISLNLQNTNFYKLLNSVNIMNGFFYRLVNIRHAYDTFCRKYYVGYSAQLSYDEIYEVYIIAKTKRKFGKKTYPTEEIYKNEFIAVKNLYDDFTENYQFGNHRYEVY